MAGLRTRKKNPAAAGVTDGATGVAPRTGAPSVRFSRTQRFASLSTRAKSYDPETRTFEFTLASEVPCRTYRGSGWGDCVQVEEVLLMAGLRNLDQIPGTPILDSHNPWSVRNVIGVLEGGRIEGTELVCVGRLSPIEDDIAANVEAGILFKFSVGFDIETETMIERADEDPLVNVTAWTVREASLVAIPADQTALMRSKPMPANKGQRADDMMDQGTGAVDQTDEQREGENADAGNPDEATVTALQAQVTSLVTAVQAIADQVAKIVGAEKDEDAAEGEENVEEGSEPSTGTKADENPVMERSAADTVAIDALRGLAKRKGFAEDFEAFVRSGATVAELRQVAIGSIRSGHEEVGGQPVVEPLLGGKGARQQLISFNESAIAKRAAAQ